MFAIMIVIDDFANSPDFTRQSKLLHKLYIRGRYQCISTITATQVCKATSPIVRKNVTPLFVFRLRNQADLDGRIEELSAVYDKKTLHQLYGLATDIQHSFSYIDLTQSDKTKTLYVMFEKRLIQRE